MIGIGPLSQTFAANANGLTPAQWLIVAGRMGANAHASTTAFCRLAGWTWAGIDALSRQFAGHRQSQLNIRLYHLAKSDAYGVAFHDVTTGNNTWHGVHGFDAGPGWDPVTGLGTPDVAKLVPLLS